MAVAIEYLALREDKDTLRETRVPMIWILGGSRKRRDKACEIYSVKEGHSLWESQKPNASDVVPRYGGQVGIKS